GINTKTPHSPYTTLGIAASSSTRNATGCRSQRGANSARKIATPSARGTASTRASSEEASVPTIIGAAPKTPATGSHTDVHRNRGPNRRNAGQALASNPPASAASKAG